MKTMRTRVLSTSLLMLPLLAAACDKPGVAPTQDTLVCPTDGGDCVLPSTPGTIKGTVVYSGLKRGDVMLLLFDANNLPPPDGTATSAVSLARIPASTMFGSQAGAGPFSAPYTFTQVVPGSYQIRALIDVNGEFDPFFDYLQQPRAGYPVGGHVSFAQDGTPSLANFEVPANTVVTSINVAIGQELLFDPPSFIYGAGSPNVLSTNIDRPQFLSLSTVNLHVPKASFEKARFAIELKRDANGQPQISDHDGLVDVYPQVILRQLDLLQGNGQSLPVSGEDAAIVPCKVDPLPFLPQLLASKPGDAPIGASNIDVLVQPLAVKLHNGVPSPLAAIPPGNYQLIVINKSGQVWTMPNSLGTQQGIASQNIKFNFSTPLAPGGSIAGKVIYPVGRTPGNIVLQAYKGGPAVAPPLAISLPARVKLIPKQFVNFNASTRSVDYVIDGLTPGSYAVEVLDDGDGNFNSFNLLQTPTKGDMIGGVVDQLGHLQSITVAGAAVTGQDAVLLTVPGKDPAGNGTAIDPPAFELDETAGPAQIAQDARATVRLTVRAKPVSFPAGAGDVQTTFFTVGLVKDAGGATVDSDGDGLPDVYPRAFLVKLDDNDPTGLTQFAPTTVIPAAVDPTPFLPALLANGAPAILPATKLSIIVRPAALDATNPAAPTRLPVMPAGKYKVVLMNATGQLWQIPNEAGPAALDPGSVCPSPTTCGAGQVSTASQSRSFAVVPPAGAVPPGAIAGTVKLVSGQQTTVKAVYVYAFSTNDPPPPLGTGKPVSADVHFGAEMAISGGDKTLSYTLKALPAGSYYVEAVIDTRGDYALDPFLFAAAPGPGSIAGAHLDASFHLAPITVAAAPVTGQDVTALASQQLPARPAFQLADASGTVATADLTGLVSTSASPMKFTLKSSTVLDASVSTIPEAANSASFLVQLICNGTATTDADYDNLPDVYPQVRLVKLDSSDPTGMTYDTSSGGLIAIPAAVDPTPFLGTGGLSCSSGSNVKLSTQLTVLVSPAAVKQVPGQQPQPLANIPAGRYGVVVIEGTGQVWRVPNELQPALIDPRTQALAPSTFMSLATQGLGFSVGAGATPPGGAIQGNLLLSGLSPAAVGNVLIAAYRASDPPPPSGTGRPVLAKVIPRPFVALGVGAGRLQYALPGLPPDTYLVAAMHDADDRFNPILSYLATPGLGAQLAFAGGVPAPVVVTTTPVAAPDIAIDGTATPSLPFERPMFTSDATAPAVMPAGQTTPYLVTLNSTAPSALPGGLLSGSNGVIQPRFHPHLVFVNGVPQKDSFGRFLVTTTVYVTPIDPGQYGVVAVVDPRSFCGQLVSGADSDCSTGTPIVSGGVPAVAEVQSLNLIVVPTLKADLIAKAPTAGRPPSGSYRMTVIEFTGQTWSVPNELATSGGADGLGQAATFVVQ